MPALNKPPPQISTGDRAAAPSGTQFPFNKQQEAPQSRVRLHITPFTPELLPKIIPPSLREHATGISFHGIQTFPERGFGYVELPVMASDALKKKLNGSILKGAKVKIQDAKPERRRKREEKEEKVDGDGDGDADKAETKLPEKKKRKKLTDKVEEGFELPEGRKVKRGWTESAAEKKKEEEGRRAAKKDGKSSSKEKKEDRKRKRESSKYTGESEMLFRAQLEPTAATTQAMEREASEGKSKKDKKKKKSKSGKDVVVVHEFEKSKRHPGFLKADSVSGDAKPAAEYVDGKGWVDEQGNVVEEAAPSKRKSKNKRKKPDRQASPSPTVKVADTEAAATSEAAESKTADAPSTQPDVEDAEKQVHPLEALFKRPRPTSAGSSTLTSPNKPPRIDTSRAAFSFFGNEAEDDDGGTAAAPAGETEDDTADDAAARGTVAHPVPMTPFTEKDLHWRALRSAAPPPDTPGGGGPRRVFTFDNALSSTAEVEEEEEAEEEKGLDEEQGQGKGGSECGDADAAVDVDEQREGVAGDGGGLEGEERQESEFSKWFYENRGENNRAWRRRRREVMKTKRQTENRRLGRRVV